jgi:hypothetical protein
MKIAVGIVVLAGLAACASPESMYYEVAQSSSHATVIRANIGNMDRQSKEIGLMRVQMDAMAIKECVGDMALANERISTGGPYYTWLERTYDCL